MSGPQGPSTQAFGQHRPARPVQLENSILKALPDAERAAVQGACEFIEFPQGASFGDPGQTPAHAWFIESGVVSSVATLTDGRTIETYMVGPEGLTHAAFVVGNEAMGSRLQAQTAGSGLRIEIGRLRSLIEQSTALRDGVVSYVVRLLGELEQSVACNALHGAEPRFAKWLLRCHDRTRGDTLQLTQEALAAMLGAQRTTVNEAAQQLQKAGAIRYSRGRIAITDRAALERAACECYGAHRRG